MHLSNLSKRICALLFLAWALVSLPAQNVPHIGYVYPAGGRLGSTFQIVVGGQYLGGVSNAWITGAGVQATLLEYSRPLNQKEANDLREQLKILQDRKNSTNATWTADDQKLIATIRYKLATLTSARQQTPALAETAIFSVELAANIDPGPHELRLGTTNGLSNPLRFEVGQWPEFSHRAATRPPEPPPGQELKPRPDNRPMPPTELQVEEPCVVNGQILQGQVDQIRFHALKGQHLVISAQARELIPYLADAVPGWFQATLTLFGPNGRELAYADHYLFHPDPVLFFNVPEDGDYSLAVHDSVYRGREDFTYRVTIAEQPWLTSLFPLGGSSGSTLCIALQGSNLTQTQMLWNASSRGPGVYSVYAPQRQGRSNPAWLAIDSLPEETEVEPNDSAAASQLVHLPLILNGRIDSPADQDVFRFQGHAGQLVIAEVLARRLGSPLDSFLRLTDQAGNSLATNDDFEDKAFGLLTHHADSYLQAQLPADGTYYIYLSDAQHQGGSAFAYRLRLSAPRPDFALRLAPSSLTVRPGATVPATVYALRYDGFTNEIQIRIAGLTNGFKLSGGTIPANRDQIRLTLTAPVSSQLEPFTLRLEGVALQGKQQWVRPVIPAEDMMQAFSYRHLVPAEDLKIAIRGRYQPRAVVRVLSPTPVKIPVDGTATVRLSLPKRALAGNVRLEINDGPEGLEIQTVTSTVDATEVTFFADAQVKVGLKGNLILNAFIDRPQPAPASRQPKRQRAPISALPAIPFETIPTQ